MLRYTYIWFVLAAVSVSQDIFAQTIHVVTKAQDNEVNSLRQVISIAQSGDTIFFSSGLRGDTLTLDSNSLTISKNLTIIGFHDTSLTIIAKDSARLLEISQGSTTKIAYINFIGGRAGSGGGILNEGNTTLLRSRIAHCNADYGGGFFNDSTADLFLIESTIEENEATSDGGGIFNFGNCIVEKSTINNNLASFLHGGGISHLMGNLLVLNSTISSNKCRKFGGGIYNAGVTDIDHATIVFNDAERGGGIFNVFQQGFLTGSHSLIALNTIIVAGPDVHDPNGNDVISKGYNLIGDISFLTSAIGSTGDIFGFPEDPIDPLIEPLTLHGGYTKTHALQCFSPAINKGDSINVQLTDQRGLPRNYDSRVDIGAFELQEDSCELVGIASLIEENMLLYPNPADEYVRIDFEGRSESLDVKVFSMDGKLIQRYNIGNERTLMLGDLVPGVYFIHIVSRHVHFTNKLIINR